MVRWNENARNHPKMSKVATLEMTRHKHREAGRSGSARIVPSTPRAGPERARARSVSRLRLGQEAKGTHLAEPGERTAKGLLRFSPASQTHPGEPFARCCAPPIRNPFASRAGALGQHPSGYGPYDPGSP